MLLCSSAVPKRTGKGKGQPPTWSFKIKVSNCTVICAVQRFNFNIKLRLIRICHGAGVSGWLWYDSIPGI